jgi:ribonuclease J
MGIVERRRLAFSGHVTVSIVIDENGDVLRDPSVALIGLPGHDADGRPLAETATNAALGALDSIPRRRRRDPETVSEAVRRAVRAAISDAWGKKPVCTVLVAVV